MEESLSPLHDLIAKRLIQAGVETNREVASRNGMAKRAQVKKKAEILTTEENQNAIEAVTAAVETALAEPDFVRMEKNIAAFGFFTPSSKRIKNVPKIIKFTQTIDGNRVEAEVKISPNVEYGIPITADQDKYLAFQKIIERCKRESGKVENPIMFSAAELIKLLGQSDAGLNFKEVYEWLDLMQGTQIKSQGAIWIAGKKRFATDVFNLFSRVKRVGDELEDGTVADKNYVWLSDWYLENLNAHYLLPVDFESYKKLKNNIAKALIPLLQVWLYASRETGTFEKRYSEVCQVLNIKIYKYVSDIKRFFGRSLDELVKQGYLSNWEVAKTADGKDFKIIFKHGQKFYADRRLIKQLSEGRVKRGTNGHAEARKSASRVNLPEKDKKSVTEQISPSGDEPGNDPETVSEGNLPDTMTAEHLEAIQELHIGYKIAYDKALLLVTENLPETRRQLAAFSFREAKPKNKAGFLIDAIEQKYSLPASYYDHIHALEQKEAATKKQLEIDACTFCDERGWRNIKSEKDVFYGVMHQCTHNAEIEAQLEEQKL